MEFKVSQIAQLLGGEVEGDPSLLINTLSDIEHAAAGAVSFLSNPKYESHIYSTKASAVIVSKEFKAQSAIAATLIRVDDPYLGFTALLEEYHKMKSFDKTGIEEPSFMDASSRHGENIYRGAFSYIGRNVSLGDNCKIYPNAYLGDRVSVGGSTIIYAGAKVYADCVIGSHCVIHSGAVIGSDGFGFAPQQDGSYRTIPQLGNVIIEDHVDIGANTTIDRSTFKSTIIRKGTKLDNLIQIAHNSDIGSDTVIAAQTGISGSSTVGNNCMIAGQVGIVGHVRIADKTTIGAQSGISKSIKREGATVLGSPAYDINDYKKSLVLFRRLPDLLSRIKQLERKILDSSRNPAGAAAPESLT